MGGRRGGQQEAEAIASRLRPIEAPPAKGNPVTFGEFLTDRWMPCKRRQVRATTGYRYAWMADRYVVPLIGAIPLRQLRADHLDLLYHALAKTGGDAGTGLAPKTIHEVHLIVRAALDLAVESGLIASNAAHRVRRKNQEQPTDRGS